MLVLFLALALRGTEEREKGIKRGIFLLPHIPFIFLHP